MCSLENAFNCFITDDKTKEMISKYEEQDKKLIKEVELKKSALLNKFNITFNKVNYFRSATCDKIFASVYKHNETNELFYSYINHDLDNNETNPYIWLNEDEWNKMKEEFEIKKQLKDIQLDNLRPELGKWLAENQNILTGHKLEIYEENGIAKTIIAIFDNNANFLDNNYGTGDRIRFKDYPSKESISLALKQNPVAYLYTENDNDVDYHYTSTPQDILDKYL